MSVLPFEKVLRDVSRGVRKIPQREFLPEGLHPVIDQGQQLVAGFSNCDEGLCTTVPAIVFGDHTRCVKFVDEPFVAGADGVKILVAVRDGDNPRYLYHALRSADIPSLGYSRHFKLVKELTFVMPDRNQQDEVVRLLDGILERRSFAEKQLDTLDELVKSRFVEMFGDPDTNPLGFDSKPGSKLFKIGNGKAKPNAERFERGVPAYGGNGVSWYTNEALVEHATIVIGRVGRHCGNTRLVEEPCWVTDNAMFIKDFRDTSFDLSFLSWLMEIIGFNRFADKGDLWKITQKPFMEYDFYTPPLVLQQEFAAFVRQVDKLKFETQQAIDKLQMLYDSLAQEYFAID